MERTGVNIVKAALSLGADIATELPILLLQNVVVIVFLFAAGTWLILARLAFFLSLPFIRHHSTIIAFLVNAIITVVELIVEAFEIVWDGFASVTNIVSTIFDTDLDVPTIDVKFKNPLDGTVSAADIVTFVQYVHDVCASYDNVYTVGGDAVKLYVAEPVCDATRFMYPVEWLRKPFAVVSPLYFGSADPNGGNCENNSGHAKTLSAVCCGIGAGYIILEAILPLFLVILILIAIGKPLLRIGWNGLILFGEVVGKTGLHVFELLEYFEV
jgi:hypothetical protein